jgi:hypothetical protein
MSFSPFGYLHVAQSNDNKTLLAIWQDGFATPSFLYAAREANSSNSWSAPQVFSTLPTVNTSSVAQYLDCLISYNSSAQSAYTLFDEIEFRTSSVPS